MKKFTFRLLALTLFAAIGACGGTSENSGPQINDVPDLNTIKEQLVAELGDDVSFYKLALGTSGYLSSSFGTGVLYYLYEGADYTRTFSMILDKFTLAEPVMAAEGFQKEFFLKKKQGKLSLKELDITRIATDYERALKLIPSEFENFELGDYTLSVANDNTTTAEFIVQATKKGESPKQEGTMEVTDYYELKFMTDTGGKVQIKN